jgi:glycosyltransferase involved in cell wall biosynthesis
MNKKYLAVIVTPPEFKVSGGVKAGLELSRAMGYICSYEVALMADQDSSKTELSGLSINRFRCMNRLGALASFAPRALRTISFHSPGLAAYIVRTQPKLVHFHNPHPSAALWGLAKVCLAENIPYVISAHGFVEFANVTSWLGSNPLKTSAFEWLAKTPFRKSVANAKAILLTSPPEHEVADALDIPKEKRFIVTNGYDPFFTQPALEEDLIRVRDRFGLDGQLPVFLFVGNHTPNKGIDTLLTACHQAQRDWRVVIGGAIRTPEEHMALRSTYNVEVLGKQVVFTDFLSREELRALYQLVDGFVFPTKADTLPLVILDAMASSLPVVATNVGGIPYEVDDTTGRLIEPNNPTALAAALDELAASRELRRELGVAGLHRVQERFNWDASARSALMVYEQIQTKMDSKRGHK